MEESANPSKHARPPKKLLGYVMRSFAEAEQKFGLIALNSVFAKCNNVRDRLTRWANGTGKDDSPGFQVLTNQCLLAIFGTSDVEKPVVIPGSEVEYEKICKFVRAKTYCDETVVLLRAYLEESHVERRALAASRKQPGLSHRAATSDLLPFPRCIRDIASLIDSAQTEVCAFVDCVDFGSFRSDDHQFLIDSLCKAADRDVVSDASEEPRKIEVKYIVWREPRAMSWANMFHEMENRRTKKFRDCLAEYLERCESYARRGGFVSEWDIVRSLSQDDDSDWGPVDGPLKSLTALLNQFQRFQLRTLRKAGIFPDTPETEGVATPFEVFFWIVDRSHMALVKPRLPHDARAQLIEDPFEVHHHQTLFDRFYASLPASGRQS